MASPFPPSAASHRSHAPYSTSSTKAQPHGTFLPGTKVQVGSHRVQIEKYLSEGGFAHVYVVRVPKEGTKYELAVLKRVAVPDKDHLASMRTEVETMKKLVGHRHIVRYMDSHASQLKGGGYEVFLLMEYCSGGGLIDFMNTRLQHRLTEPEILKIFSDVATGVAAMHYLKPPLLHRDLKVENVLISKKTTDGTPMYKLCDFGSTASPRPAAKTADEGRLVEEDVQKHTTMQYRSPEMIDVWRKQPIDEKADIWALGVLLYKLCYYTTPFEEVGQMAILNASYKFPAYPSFSSKLKQLISWMLKEDPKERPDVYQVVHQACRMQGLECPVKDIYAGRSQSEARRNETLPSRVPEVISSPPAGIGLAAEVPKVQVQALPEIAPMRRGRPTVPSQTAPIAAKPSPSPARGDPFAALDSKNFDVRAAAADELSKKYPSLDEFAITHDTRGFGGPSRDTPSTAANPATNDLGSRVANALADEVFSGVQSPPLDQPMAMVRSTTQLARSGSAPQAKSPTKTKSLASMGREASRQSPLIQPSPIRPGQSGNVRPLYRSTGTGPSPPPKPPRPTEQLSDWTLRLPDASKRPIWRVPQSPSSSRPSLEGCRPSNLGIVSNDESGVHRAKSAQGRPRPSSEYVSNNLEFLRSQEHSRKPSNERRKSMEAKRQSRDASPQPQPFRLSNENYEQAVEDAAPIGSDLEYLRSNEDHEGMMRRHSRNTSTSGHKKRTSLPGISGAKKIFSGGFGDAFKRFEKDHDDGEENGRPVTPEANRPILSPVLGSEATTTPSRKDESMSDSRSTIDETEDLPPDMRREMERRRLEQEEKRVEQAAAEYRDKFAANGTGGSLGPTKASTIQKRVQSLLDDGRQSPQPKKSAEGYGKYTQPSERGEQVSQKLPPRTSSMPEARSAPSDRGVAGEASDPQLNGARVRQQPTEPRIQAAAKAPSNVPPASSGQASSWVPPSQAQPQRAVSRPSAPPKPTKMRAAQWPPLQSIEPGGRNSAEQPLTAKPTGLAALLAKDMEGVPEYPDRSRATHTPQPAVSELNGVRHDGETVFGRADENGDLEANFSKRYPSLAGIEMVETEINRTGSLVSDGDRRLRVKEV